MLIVISVALIKLACLVIFLNAAYQVSSINTRVSSMDVRLRRMETILDQLRPETTILAEGSPNQNEAVRSLILEGQLLDAIKLYQEETGASFRDAKDAIDAIQGRIA